VVTGKKKKCAKKVGGKLPLWTVAKARRGKNRGKKAEETKGGDRRQK